MHPPPRVAIIVPTLNRPHTLRRCLASIKAQTFTDWACVIIDQGDHVIDVPETYDKRFVHVEISRRSASLARNIGLGIAKALSVEYICLIDDDDRIEPTYLEEMAAALDDVTLGTDILVACNGTYIGKVFPYSHASTKLIGSRMVRTSAIGDRKFEARSGQEKHFWRSFDNETQKHIDKTLYHATRDPVGGLRDDGGSY